MTREEEFKHEGFVYANNIYKERKCELFEVKDIAHDFVQGAIYADQNPRKGLWDAKKVVEWILNNYGTYEQTYTDNSGNHTYSDFQIGQFIRNLREAMEENNDCN